MFSAWSNRVPLVHLDFETSVMMKNQIICWKLFSITQTHLHTNDAHKQIMWSHVLLQIRLSDVLSCTKLAGKLLRFALIHLGKFYVFNRRRRWLIHLFWVAWCHLVMQAHVIAVHVVGLVAAVRHLLILGHQYEIIEIEIIVVRRWRLHEAVNRRQCDFRWRRWCERCHR